MDKVDVVDNPLRPLFIFIYCNTERFYKKALD